KASSSVRPGLVSIGHRSSHVVRRSTNVVMPERLPRASHPLHRRGGMSLLAACCIFPCCRAHVRMRGARVGWAAPAMSNVCRPLLLLAAALLANCADNAGDGPCASLLETCIASQQACAEVDGTASCVDCPAGQYAGHDGHCQSIGGTPL